MFVLWSPRLKTCWLPADEQALIKAQIALSSSSHLFKHGLEAVLQLQVIFKLAVIDTHEQMLSRMHASK